MRPLKYKDLGEMNILRVPHRTATILPQLQALMQQLEENGRDSCEVISEVLDNIADTLR